LKKYYSYIILFIAFSLFGLYASAQDVKIHPSVDSVFIPVEGDQQTTRNKKQRFSLVQPQDKNIVSSRQIDNNHLNNIKQDKAFWYADYKPARKAEKKQSTNIFSSLLSSQFFKILLFNIFASAILWFVITGDFKIFRRQSAYTKHKGVNEPGQNIFDTDFETEISKAITANDYPLAIRLHYLHILKELSLRNIIQYSADHTNHDFVHQLRNSRYYNDFFSLTRSFEYTWYGKFNVSEPAFEKIQNNFNSFKQQLKN
jgi:hypothetical protein